MLSTKQLRYFDALARLGHFGKAAASCAVTQPALSMQISQLEAELGLRLVERQGGRMVLTGAGQEIARRAAGVLQSLRDLADFAASCQAPFSTPMRLGVIPTIAPYLLPKLLPRLGEAFPQLMLHIRETQTAALVDDLQAGRLDVLVVALPVEADDLATLEIGADRFLLALAPGARGYGRSRVSPEVLGRERLLLLEEGHCLRDQALSLCPVKPASGTKATGQNRAGPDRLGTDVLGAASLSTLVQMVASGLGVTLLPEIGARYEAAHSGIRLVRFRDPEPQRMIGLAWRRSSPRGPEFETLGGLVREALAIPSPAG